jgi:predicted nuclease of restriction endonuclease-like RecB superfamily
VIQDPKECWTIGTELEGLSEIKVVGWSNIDQAPELVEIHTAHVSERRRELDAKLNKLVEIDTQIRELTEGTR